MIDGYGYLAGIRGYDAWKVIEPVTGGWSDDKKFYMETGKGEKLLLRISDAAEYIRKKEEFEAVKRLESLHISVPQALDIGMADDGKKVYMLLSWIDGDPAETVLPSISKEDQYDLGIRAGRLLKKMHSVPAPLTQEPWDTRFGRKMDGKIKLYAECGYAVSGEEKMIRYMNTNRRLFKDRPQCFQHGDFHVGNLIVSRSGDIGAIDFNRFDYGDPWEEFNRIVWCAGVSGHFASGRINGYFDGPVPEEFFRLMALYIASNQISTVCWAVPFGQAEIDTMLRQTEDILEYYDGMTAIIPKWYIRGL
jgi:aminoglycoside phosphotransferase (APT) family kinase protein